MLANALIIHLLRFSTTFATGIPPQNFDLDERATMQGQIPTFLESLQLVPSQHQDLISQLESAQTVSCNTNFSGVGLACRGARASLGSESVATKPANQTEADANWLVVISL